MRTTVHLDPDLDQRLRRKASELGLTFKEVVNRTLALGLSVEEKPSEPYRVRAKACGFRTGIDLNHLNRLVDEIEVEP